jgi:signal transduction histidine kinase/DNA-binding NarL/FixJ family response regulator
MAAKNRIEKQTLRYKFLLLFALSSVLPVLLFLFILYQHGLIHNPSVMLLLGMTWVVAILGFLFFMRVVRQVTALARDFARVEHGEIENLGVHDDPAEFSEMARIADAFSTTLAGLKQHTRELENLVTKLSTLSELTELVVRIPDIRQVLQVILQRTMAAVNANIGSIMIMDEESQVLRIAAANGLDESVVKNTAISIGEGIAGKVAQTGEPVLVEDVEKDSRFQKTNYPKYESSSFISMPLRAHWRILGVLNLSKKGDRKAFTESDMKFLTALLGHIGFALENAKLLQEAKESARRLQQAYEQQSERLDQAHQQIVRSDKLSSLGQLVAGVAHELNNPLTTMIGRAELLLTEISGGKASRDLQQIVTEGERAAKIVQNLLSFSRQTSPAKQFCNINEILRRVLQILENDFRVNNIQVRTEMDPQLPQTMVDAGQMQQVFVNIANNAHQAMMGQEDRRSLTIRTRLDQDKLRVEFSDTGPGIPAEQQQHIFEPFFTTKSEGQGTGLGLSISCGILQAHGGRLDVKSLPGEGTTFVIELPVLAAPLKVSVDEPTVAPPVTIDVRKVLIIDDEQNIGEMISEMLANEGCETAVVTTGELALQKMKEHDYDVILCDIRMPGTDGREIYRQVTRHMPQLVRRFVFLTGDISDQTRDFLEETGNLHFMKPFTRQTLMQAIKQAGMDIPISREQNATMYHDLHINHGRHNSVHRPNLRLAKS